MNPADDRVAALEEKVARLEGILTGLREEVEALRLKRVKVMEKSHHHDPRRAIEMARREEQATLAGGLKLAGGLILVALLCWGGFELYRLTTDRALVGPRASWVAP